MQKGQTVIFLLIGLIVLVVVTGGAYYLGIKRRANPILSPTSASPVTSQSIQPSPIPTASIVLHDKATNSKTYTNSKYGYSFEYPAEWANCPEDFGGGDTDSTIYLCSSSVQPLDYVWTSFTPNPQNLDFKQLITKDLPQDIKDNFKYTTATYAQNTAYITDTLPGGSPSREVFFKTSSNAYIGIAYQPNNQTAGFFETYNSYKIFQRILSTFKFIDSTSKSGYASWKQYQVYDLNKQSLNISYKLPADVKEPLCANAGCYYRETNLPGGSSFAIIPIGKNQALTFSWSELVSNFIKKNKLSQEPGSVLGKEALEFSGNFDGKTYPQDLNLLDDSVGEYKGVLVQINQDLSLETIIYQSKFTKGEIDFTKDAKLFEQILDTFKMN